MVLAGPQAFHRVELFYALCVYYDGFDVCDVSSAYGGAVAFFGVFHPSFCFYIPDTYLLHLILD